MKEITQERILKALDKNDKYLKNRPEDKIIDILTRIGIRISNCDNLGCEGGKLLSNREYLELNYLGFYDRFEISKRLSYSKSNKSEAIEGIWFDTWSYLLDRKLQRDCQIRAIQKKYQVSGLKQIELNLGQEILKFHRPHLKLDLISSDRDILRSQRIKIAEAFLSTFKQNSMKLYQMALDDDDNDEWIETTPDRIMNLVRKHEWADIWSNKYYLNYHELYTVGQTIHKKRPESIFDEFVWELNLSTGKGIPDDTEIETQFCARIGRGVPSI